MTKHIRDIELHRIKSRWYNDILEEWHPEKDYIAHLVKTIEEKHYIAPIVVVQENDHYYIVNGHHRFYAHLVKGEKKIKCIIMDGTFEDTEPLRKAEVLLKEFDQKTEYRYQVSGYLDRWAAAAESQQFINKFRPTYKFRLYKFLKNIIRRQKN